MKYKLIKEYPGSPKLNTICEYTGNPYNDPNVFTNPVLDPINYPEYWQPVIEKNYEILSYITVESEIIKYKDLDIDDDCNCDKYLKIYSVKRLSDGEIFTIGDKIEFNNHFGNNIIKNIKIENNKIWFYFNKKDESCILEGIKKIKQPLFTTEDGVDIFDYSESFYWIRKNTLKLCERMTLNTPHSVFFKYEPNKELYFSTKEKAEEYILLNKPCLSLNDILSLEILESNSDIELLENLIKLKIKYNSPCKL